MLQTSRQIWITRPNPDGEQMASLARESGMVPWQMPVMEIFWQVPSQQSLRQLMQAQSIIVTSRHAVTSLTKASIQLPSRASYLAVGRSTASALAAQDIQAIVPTQCDSDGLLREPELAQVDGKRIVILKGEGGRTLLQTELQKKGALITELALYRRVCKSVDQGMLTTFLQQDHAIVSVASAESLTCALKGTPLAFRKQLMSLPLVVMSERIARYAKDKGWKGPLQVATEASSAGLIEASKLCYLNK